MNNNTNIYSDIFNLIRTKDTALEISEDIDIILSAMYKMNGKTLIELIENQFPKKIGMVLIAAMEKNNTGRTDLNAYREFFSGLQEAIKQAKIVDLTLSIEPDYQLINTISDYLRDAFSENNALISIRIDPKTVGGIELIWKGRYWNFTLEKQIDEWFKNNSITGITQ